MPGDYRGDNSHARPRQGRESNGFRDSNGKESGYRDSGPRGASRRSGEYDNDRRGIPLSQLDPTTTDASRKAIGVAIEVHKALGPGYSSDIYLAAVRSELEALGLDYKLSHSLPVEYKGKTIGQTVVPLLVHGRFLLDILSKGDAVTTYERLVMRAQLKASNLDLGLIINFGERRLKEGLVRVINIEKLTREKGVSFDEHASYDDHLAPTSQREEGPELADFH